MSQRITIQIAKDIARELSKPHYEAYHKKEEELKNLATDIYLKTVPENVKKLSKKDSQYLRTSSTMQCIGNGFNHDNFPIYDSPSKDSWAATVSPSEEDAKLLQKTAKEVADLKGYYTKLKEEIEIALTNLRTYSKVEKEFPEAFKLLPNSIPTSLAININDIRKKL